MDDLISRQAAIDALRDAENHAFNSFYKGLAKAHKIIADLPSAKPERAKGKWISEAKGKEAILDEFGNVTCSAHCSECGDWLTASDEYSCRGRYCPNCGADMRGEKDEQR